MRRRLGPADPMRGLAQWTAARLATGRVDASATTEAVLDFNMDHARARDAIHTALPVEELTQQLEAAGFSVLRAKSQARDRAEYLRRPDLGRRLSPESRVELEEKDQKTENRVTFVVADGLSSMAPALHALPLLEHVRSGLAGWSLDRVVVATQARVALGDEIGAARRAEAVIVLIGERPGLKSFDSLGAYLTYQPEAGRSDAERNCVSNIRAEGLSYEEAAFKLLHLLHGARALQRSGVSLKEEAGPLSGPAALVG